MTIASVLQPCLSGPNRDRILAAPGLFKRPVLIAALAAAGVLLLVPGGVVPPGGVSFAESSRTVQAFDFIEISARISAPHAQNPFTDAEFRGTFTQKAGNRRWQVEGFCDAEDGSVYRVRFMPSTAGEYTYSVEYRQGLFHRTSTGTFQVTNGGRRGPIRIDPGNRWHFIWEGTGEHYFFNGTTAYWLIGWRDDEVIRSSIDRLQRLKINRIRVTLAGRTNLQYGEPVMAGDRG